MKIKLTRRDWWTFPVLILVLGLLAVMSLDSTQGLQSDDYAAYLNEAIAISEGRQADQDRLNVFMHPSPLSFLNESEDSLTYVWGYPLVLAVIHRIVGFDTWNFNSLIFYKIPGACALAALGGLLFLFYRRHFSYLPSLLLSLLFCLSPDLFQEVNTISPELPFLLFFVLGFWLIEVILDQSRLSVRIPLLFGLGIVFWYTCLLRLNGTVLIIFVALAHFFGIWRNAFSSKRFVFELLPYIVCFSLIQISYSLLPAPTSNSSDIGKVAFSTVCLNAAHYFRLFDQWLGSLFAYSNESFFYANFSSVLLLMLMLLGIFKKGCHENLHFALLIFSTFVTVCLLDYRQGLRYIFTLLPFALLFVAHGAAFLSQGILSHCDEYLKRISKHIFMIVGILVVSFIVIQNTQSAFQHFINRGKDLPTHSAYSTQSVDLYRYIQTETAEDSVIAYFKPRCLYLNTGRVSFKPQISDHLLNEQLLDSFLPYQPRYIPLSRADYILIYSDIFDDEYSRIVNELGDSARLELVYHNSIYRLFKVIQ